MSAEDRKFLDIMKKGIHVNEAGNLEMPLPFKDPNVRLPANQAAVFKRTQNTLQRLRSEPDKLQQCLEAMGKNIKAGHVEKVPQEEANPKDNKAWWLPVFPVPHPKKGKVRLVFDCSASYSGTSLTRPCYKAQIRITVCEACC